MEPLSRYDRATLALWSRSHAQLASSSRPNYLAEAAVHALLSRLRQHSAETLFSRYDVESGADFALLQSIMVEAPSEVLWQVRDAAFYLRWTELSEVTG